MCCLHAWAYAMSLPEKKDFAEVIFCILVVNSQANFKILQNTISLMCYDNTFCIYSDPLTDPYLVDILGAEFQDMFSFMLLMHSLRILKILSSYPVMLSVHSLVSVTL